MSALPRRPNRAAFAAPALIILMRAALAARAQYPRAAPAAAPPVATLNAAVMAPATDIRDIRGPKPLGSPWLIRLVAMTSLLAVGGAYAAWAWNRRRFRGASKRPLDIALDRLEKARQLMTPLRGREFSIEVSSAVRDYIERRFDLRAAHLTTDEFLHQLLEPMDSPLAAHRSLLEHFMQTCDLAKFGGWNLAVADMEAMLQSARRFIAESGEGVASHGIATATDPAGKPSIAASRETYVSLSAT
jgi:hypothetical protein